MRSADLERLTREFVASWEQTAPIAVNRVKDMADHWRDVAIAARKSDGRTFLSKVEAAFNEEAAAEDACSTYASTSEGNATKCKADVALLGRTFEAHAADQLSGVFKLANEGDRSSFGTALGFRDLR